MIIISNTSPLTNLATIGKFDLLRQLYAELHITDGVWQELNAKGQHWPGQSEVAQAEWIHQHTVQNQSLVIALQRDLDRGEAESIALAVEQNAGLVLLDEQEGRRVAERFKLHVIGVAGILLEAKAKNLISTVQPYMDALRQEAGFYLSESVYQYILQAADEVHK